jgi:hypothetical protein
MSTTEVPADSAQMVDALGATQPGPTQPGLSPAVQSAATPSRRLASLDALRGFDMFWIIGVDDLVPRLSRYSWAQSNSSWGRALHLVAAQFDHVAWQGLHFEDLIFPLFVFIVGVIADPARWAGFSSALPCCSSWASSTTAGSTSRSTCSPA